MKLIILPLAFLAIMALFAQLGLAEYALDPYINQNFDSEWTAPSDGTFDLSGHKLLDENGFRTGEFGLCFIEGNQMYWLNATNAASAIGIGGVDPFSRDKTYPCFQLATGEQIVFSQAADLNVSISDGSLMMIAIIVGLIVLAAVAGLKVFGSGISEVSVATIVKGTGFIAIWGILSLAAIGLITGVPIFGIAFYFFLTLLYTVGIMGQIGGGSDV